MKVPEKYLKPLLNLIRIGVSIVALALILTRIDLPELRVAVARFTLWGWTGASIAEIFASLIIPALVVRTLHLGIPLLPIVRTNFIMRMYSLVLPMLVTVGIRWKKYSAFVSAKDAGPIVLWEKAIQLAGLAAVAALGVSLGPAIPTSLKALPWLAATVALAPALGFALLKIDPVRRLLSGLQPEAMTPRAFFLIYGYMILGPLMGAAGQTLLVQGAGIDLGYWQVLWIRSCVSGILMLPISYSGLGIREVSLVGILGLLGIDSASAVAYGLTLFSLQIANALIGFGLEVSDRGKINANR